MLNESTERGKRRGRGEQIERERERDMFRHSGTSRDLPLLTVSPSTTVAVATQNTSPPFNAKKEKTKQKWNSRLFSPFLFGCFS